MRLLHKESISQPTLQQKRPVLLMDLIIIKAKELSLDNCRRRISSLSAKCRAASIKTLLNFIEFEQINGAEALSGCIGSIVFDIIVKRNVSDHDLCSMRRNGVTHYVILRSSATCVQVGSPNSYMPARKDKYLCRTWKDQSCLTSSRCIPALLTERNGQENSKRRWRM